MKRVIGGLAALLFVGAVGAETLTTVVPCPDSPQPGISVAAATKTDAQNPWRYPAQARRNREHGTVTLKLVLDEQGAAQRVALVKGSGSSALDRAATAGAKSKSVRFCPMHGETPVTAGIAVVNVTYSLTQTVAQL
ncbi:MAG TPA: energy transducer TonB [Patescibacteria group bacterium]|nr:energy transducer TonB [Patescibacteria group bacterium]